VKVWENNDVQFPRLLTEVAAVLTTEQYKEIALSMDLTLDDVTDLFERAERVWDNIKAKK
jgi:hypothetical protein